MVTFIGEILNEQLYFLCSESNQIYRNSDFIKNFSHCFLTKVHLFNLSYFCLWVTTLFFLFVKLRAYGTKCVTHIWNVKFNNIRCVANMLSGLAEYHVSFSQYFSMYKCMRHSGKFTGIVEAL